MYTEVNGNPDSKLRLTGNHTTHLQLQHIKYHYQFYYMTSHLKQQHLLLNPED